MVSIVTTRYGYAKVGYECKWYGKEICGCSIMHKIKALIEYIGKSIDSNAIYVNVVKEKRHCENTWHWMFGCASINTRQGPAKILEVYPFVVWKVRIKLAALDALSTEVWKIWMFANHAV